MGRKRGEEMEDGGDHNASHASCTFGPMAMGSDKKKLIGSCYCHLASSFSLLFLTFDFLMLSALKVAEI
jgi:hypothetical protein